MSKYCEGKIMRPGDYLFSKCFRRVKEGSKYCWQHKDMNVLEQL